MKSRYKHFKYSHFAKLHLVIRWDCDKSSDFMIKHSHYVNAQTDTQQLSGMFTYTLNAPPFLEVLPWKMLFGENLIVGCSDL